ncbi:MAG: peptidylprolyl isomerase [Bacteroidota bacterium]
MRNIFIFCSLVLGAFLVTSCGPKQSIAEIDTPYGKMKVLLYESTPQHSANFIKLVEEGFYDSLLFHRVIEGFMIQGGDPDSRGAGPNVPLGMGGPGYTVPAEIGAPHIKGALSAARTQNPEKASSGSQFYIVQGKGPMSDAEIDSWEQRKGIKYNQAQRDLYKELGGTPQLDQDYTVFGEVIEGFDVIDKIAAERTSRERPINDMWMTIRMISK